MRPSTTYDVKKNPIALVEFLRSLVGYALDRIIERSLFITIQVIKTASGDDHIRNATEESS
jgi:hypothetical protein